MSRAAKLRIFSASICPERQPGVGAQPILSQTAVALTGKSEPKMPLLPLFGNQKLTTEILQVLLDFVRFYA